MYIIKGELYKKEVSNHSCLQKENALFYFIIIYAQNKYCLFTNRNDSEKY